MTLPKGYNEYGAFMGRRNSVTSPEEKLKFRMRKLRWVDGDYDEGGAYWGYVSGTHIYQAEASGGDEVQEIFVRAYGREDAKALVRETFPSATFYR